MSEYMNNINPETNNSVNAEQTIVDTKATESGASFEGNGMNSQGNPYVKESSGSRKPKNLKSGAMVAVAVCVAAALTITGVATNGFGLAKSSTTNTASISSSNSGSSSDSSTKSGTNTVKAADA
ncbi:MAG: hypothetical protein VZQ80_09045, partial [Lachnospiraceae bacterium]|nr:hypothetical protein [Lachnospiraceae bacterium]